MSQFPPNGPPQQPAPWQQPPQQQQQPWQQPQQPPAQAPWQQQPPQQAQPSQPPWQQPAPQTMPAPAQPPWGAQQPLAATPPVAAWGQSPPAAPAQQWAAPPAQQAPAAAAGAWGNGDPLADIFKGAGGIEPSSSLAKIDVDGAYKLKLRKITGAQTQTEKMPYVEFEFEIVASNAGPTMVPGKIVGIFIPLSQRKFEDLFIRNIKDVLCPLMSRKYNQAIQFAQIAQKEIMESYSQAQPYTGVELVCHAKNSGKVSKKGNAIFDYQWVWQNI